jgi:hypothetical protein
VVSNLVTRLLCCRLQRRPVMVNNDNRAANVSSSQPEQPSSSGASSSTTAPSSPSEALSHETSAPLVTAGSAFVSTNSPVSQPENRAELRERARSFLTSPKIRHEDLFAKRRFLAEKGLSDAEITGLLQELVDISMIIKHALISTFTPL